ncbi:hypothetical protein V6N13_143109 [Hibiscus sabdariffa]|uniref:Uncharacterized protein n=1 Tax=Hibiscus sabdariffa TaxID=183260 RepID=A0ABR2FGK3_9ROSI
MEDFEKINGKKKLSSIPTNYVTLLQLRERWNKEKERKQKGKEDEAEPLQQEKKETIVEERVDDEVSGRGREKGRFPRLIRDNGKRVADVKPSDDIIAVAEDFDIEKKGEEFKKKKNKNWKNKKRNGMEEKVRAANEREEMNGRAGNALLPASTKNNEGEEELIGDETHAPELTSAEEVNVEARREPRQSFTPRTHGRKFQAMPMGGNIITGAYAPKLASVKEENDEARMESQPRIMPRIHGRTAEIGRKFQAMSMNGEIRTGYYRRYDRQNVDFNHRRNDPELNRTHNATFGRRRELNRRSEGMVWVKKREVKGQNVSEIQSSSCSSKEVD